VSEGESLRENRKSYMGEVLIRRNGSKNVGRKR
jgi:hypothetical protein